MDKIKIAGLQYITQDIERYPHTALAEQACKAGADWVQLRMKNKPLHEVEEVARKVREICSRYNATFILNDYVEIAKTVRADGVHLGKRDMFPDRARQILEDGFIIGGTANTFEEIQELARSGVDYIGLGPYRFTTTKENLSPVLGLEGYKEILSACREHHIHVPIIAIGGIKKEDIELLFQTGINGIAVSSAIANAESPEMAIRGMISIIKKY